MATVEGLQGIIVVGDTVEECRKYLIEVIGGWILLRPRLDDLILSIKGRSQLASQRSQWPVSKLNPAPRRELIKRLKKLEFIGPYPGREESKH